MFCLFIKAIILPMNIQLQILHLIQSFPKYNFHQKASVINATMRQVNLKWRKCSIFCLNFMKPKELSQSTKHQIILKIQTLMVWMRMISNVLGRLSKITTKIFTPIQKMTRQLIFRYFSSYHLSFLVPFIYILRLKKVITSFKNILFKIYN